MKKGVLICPRCGRRAERLLTLPVPRSETIAGGGGFGTRRHLQTIETEGVVCERCLRDLEKELQREETLVMPPR